MEVMYEIDGKNFKDYGVYVSSSQGLIGGLKPKKGLEAEWPDEHGMTVDVSQMYFESRSITLNCFMVSEDAAEFIERMEAFSALFYAPGEHVLRVSVTGKGLEYKVRLADMLNVEKTFRDSLMVSSFALKLSEDEPGRLY